MDHHRRRALRSIVPLLLLALSFYGSASAQASVPLSTLEQYLSNVAGAPVTISCEPDAGFAIPVSAGSSWDGYVLPASSDENGVLHGVLPVLHIRQTFCDAAENIDHKRVAIPASYMTLNGKRYDSTNGPIALAVMLHEAMHFSLQSFDEGRVECANYRNEWSLVKQFGFPGWVASMVLTGMSEHHFEMDESYPTTYGSVC